MSGARGAGAGGRATARRPVSRRAPPRPPRSGAAVSCRCARVGGLLPPAAGVPRHGGRARRVDLRGALRDGAPRGRPRRLPPAPRGRRARSCGTGSSTARPSSARPRASGARPRARESPALAAPALPARRPAARGGAGARLRPPRALRGDGDARLRARSKPPWSCWCPCCWVGATRAVRSSR